MNLTKLSKKLSFLLRHSPDHITLDGGWAETDRIIAALREREPGFAMADLEQIVREDEKGRYSFNGDKTRIRANQGHSVPGVSVEMTQPEPPELLYHGTATRFLDSIFREGLLPMSREYVHISPDYRTAVKVGQRHGKPIVLTVRAREFVQAGHPLYLSANGVWQAKQVPPQFLEMAQPEYIKK